MAALKFRKFTPKKPISPVPTEYEAVKLNKTNRKQVAELVKGEVVEFDDGSWFIVRKSGREIPNGHWVYKSKRTYYWSDLIDETFKARFAEVK